MSFNATGCTVGNLLKSVFRIPRNQRKYVWGIENCRDLYDDVAFSISADRHHFIGSIVLEDEREENSINYYTIIDGQQRLTTITLALIAIMKLFYEKGMMDEFYGTIQYLQSTDNKNQKITNLNLESHNLIGMLVKKIVSEEMMDLLIKNFIEVNNASNDRDKAIADAILYFYNAISADIEKAEDPGKHLNRIRDEISIWLRSGLFQVQRKTRIQFLRY